MKKLNLNVCQTEQIVQQQIVMKWSDCIPRSDQPAIELSYCAAKLKNTQSKIQVVNFMKYLHTFLLILDNKFSAQEGVDVVDVYVLLLK